MGKFIELFLNLRKKQNVAITAPTNRAVRVSENMCDYTSEYIVFRTIHSLLKLRPVLDLTTGKQIFKADLNEEGEGLTAISLLVLDEASQLNDQLFEMLIPYTRTGNLKIIFVGDDLQIPPVGQVNSIPFDEEKRDFYNIGVTRITKIVRQAEGSPIIKIGQAIRGKIYRPTLFPIKENSYKTGEGGNFWINHLQVNRVLENFFNEEFLADTNRCKVLAWRNKTVANYNRSIRKILFGEAAVSKLVPGEKLLAGSTILDEQGNVIFPTYEQFEVVSFTEHKRKLAGVELEYYEVKVTSYNIKEQVIIVIHERSEIPLKKLLKSLYDRAQAKKVGNPDRKKFFEFYYGLKGFFADIRYDYAWTGHTSQGASIDTVIVDFKDMSANSNIFERNRIKYTAVTRAKKSLFILT